MNHPNPNSPVGTPPSSPTPAASPTWLDFLLVLVGVGFSLVLAGLIDLKVRRLDVSPVWMIDSLARSVPFLLLLPAGIILWWPVFFFTGRLRGRPSQLTWAETLWGFVWLLDLGLIGGIIWYHQAGVPSFFEEGSFQNFLSLGQWLVFILAGLALPLALLTSLRRHPTPWTHHMGLALLLWPMLPWLLIWLGRLEISL